MNEESILEPSFVEKILDQARLNLETDGMLVPMLVVLLSNNERGLVEMKLGATPEEKREAFSRVGNSFRQEGYEIKEALLVAEGWSVTAEKAILPLSVMPSQHPAREEVITVVGRDAEGRLYCWAVEPFGRGPDNKPVLREPAKVRYTEDGVGSESLLDELFISSSEVKGGDLHD